MEAHLKPVHTNGDRMDYKMPNMWGGKGGGLMPAHNDETSVLFDHLEDKE
jgi:hypothetical protein